MNPFFFFVSLRAKGERIATAAAQPRNDSMVTIPSDTLWRNEYRPPVHEMSAGTARRIATPVCELARNDIFVTIPSEYSWVAITDHLCTNWVWALPTDTEQPKPPLCKGRCPAGAEGLFCAIESVRKVGSFTIPQSPPYVGASSLYTREPLGERIATPV